MAVEVRPCSQDDLDRLLALNPPRHDADHHQERFALQDSGSATYLLAWRAERNVGRATVYYESKYEQVRQVHPAAAEINALAASPRGQGIGTALIRTAERCADGRGHSAIGLAVEPDNPAATRLYQRLGYSPWGQGQVIDEWTERRSDGTDVIHRDTCEYLTKLLDIAAPTRRAFWLDPEHDPRECGELARSRSLPGTTEGRTATADPSAKLSSVATAAITA